MMAIDHTSFQSILSIGNVSYVLWDFEDLGILVSCLWSGNVDVSKKLQRLHRNKVKN